MSVEAFQRAASQIDSLRAWPPTGEESVALGDVVETEPQHQFIALDFGVREWVLNLPYTESRAESRAVLAVWLADHARHVELAEQLAATGELDDWPEDLRSIFRLTGVVRGLALGERDGLIDGLGGGRILLGDGVLPPTVPGVVRSLHLLKLTISNI